MVAPLFLPGTPLEMLLWAGLTVTLFAGLLVLLLKPTVLPARRVAQLTIALCVALPVIAVIGSFDVGTVSALEVFAILVAALVGLLNWAAIRRNAPGLHAEAA
jgi:hypothetical protein